MNGVFFARQMHSTSQFDKTALSKCVCVCVWKYVNILCSNFACSALQFSRFHDTLGRLEFSFLHSQFQLSRFMVYSCLFTFVEFMPKSTPRHKMHNGKTSNDAQRHPKTSKDIQTRPNISQHMLYNGLRTRWRVARLVKYCP